MRGCCKARLASHATHLMHVILGVVHTYEEGVVHHVQREEEVSV